MKRALAVLGALVLGAGVGFLAGMLIQSREERESAKGLESFIKAGVETDPGRSQISTEK